MTVPITNQKPIEQENDRKIKIIRKKNQGTCILPGLNPDFLATNFPPYIHYSKSLTVH